MEAVQRGSVPWGRSRWARRGGGGLRGGAAHREVPFPGDKAGARRRTRRWARDGGAGGAGEEGVERAEVRGAAVRAAGAGAHPAQPPPQGTATGPGWALRDGDTGTDRLRGTEWRHGAGEQTGGAASGSNVWRGVIPWEMCDTERGHSLAVLRAAAGLSTSRVWLSKGHPAACQGWTTAAGDSGVWAGQLLGLL